MNALVEFNKIIESAHDYARNWKSETKGKVIGQFCRYVPEEVIHAAGALPVFITGPMDEFGDVDEYLQGNSCPYMRSCLAGGMSGLYDYLDALVVAHSCDLMSRMHDFWRNRTRVPSVYLLDFPHKANENGLVYFQHVLREFRSFLEDTCQAAITDEALHESIRLYNQYRRLLKEVYQTRLDNPPKISGSEALTIVLSTLLMRKENALVLLKQFLKEVPQLKPLPPKTRIMVTGTDVASLDLFEFLESCGATIVTDDLCTGSRDFWNPVEEDAAPIQALARRYLFNIPCSRTGPSEDRYRHIFSLAREYKVQGVIMPVLDFCDVHNFDSPYVLDRLKENGLPSLKLEIDYTRGGLERLRSRVEAFLEVIGKGV